VQGAGVLPLPLTVSYTYKDCIFAIVVKVIGFWV